MALIRCGECKKDVSTKAKMCPHCGAPARHFKRSSGAGAITVKIFVVLIALGVVINILGGGDNRTVGHDRASSSKTSTAKPFQAQSNAPDAASVPDSKICKAAIAAMFGRRPNTINVEGGTSPFVLSYERPQDNTTWKYRCKVQGNQIVWAGWIDGRWGRWRDSQQDALVTYRVGREVITISERYPNADPSLRSYQISSL